jgi:cold shock CspA family protein/energy-coupling factor transporter ATP-binding protein EcfA2
MNSLDRAFTAAKALIDDVEPRLGAITSEEDAKIQLITRFLTEVLGWHHSDLSAERKHDNGFSDYVIGASGQPAFLIEAKRRGTLSIATSATTRQYYKISGPALKSTLSAIEQAASYSAPEGIQLSVVTDGQNWIFFKPFIPGQNYKSKEAIVFPGLDAILAGFAEFFELASKEAHEKNLYKARFDNIHQNRALQTRSLHSAIGDHDIHLEQKSPLAFDLDRVFASFFSTITGDADPELLIECFVETRESRIADFALEKLTAHVLGNIDPSLTDVGQGLEALISSTISDQQGETVFIVGPAGAGKTTFLQRFFKKTLAPAIRGRCLVVNLNSLDATGDEAATLNWFTNGLIKAIETQLYPQGFPDSDQLQGLYQGEYLRRATGVDAHLYARDKEAFKIKFGDYMAQQVENDREGYLRRLLKDIVENRKILPVFVIDNTDEFPLAYKERVFQYFQALRRHVTYCLLLFPVTDRSAWSFSKTEIFNIYSSRSYYLPTPSPREVFKKRVAYMKTKLASRPSAKTAADYEFGKSLRVSVQNLEGFASAVEDILVDNEYVARLLGALSNYNIRKTLTLARCVITSPVLKIENLIATRLLGDTIAPDLVMLAVLKGDYNFFKKTGNLALIPLFDVPNDILQSPLLAIRILGLLKSVHDAGHSGEARYLEIASLVQYFDAAGYSDVSIEKCLSLLLAAHLVEPFDPTAAELASAQRIAITPNGLMHLELALFNRTFFAHQALTTSLPDPHFAATLRAIYMTQEAEASRLRHVREEFSSYLLAEDSRFAQIPAAPQYAIQHALTTDLRKYLSGSTNSPSSGPVSSAADALIATETTCLADWFDYDKGYGFLTIEEFHERAFLHISLLENSGINEIHAGDLLICDISRGTKGLAVSKIHRLIGSNPSAVYEASIIKIISDRGYGFVQIPALGKDAYFHFTVIPKQNRETLVQGDTLRVEIQPDPKGRGLQVRRVL